MSRFAASQAPAWARCVRGWGLSTGRAMASGGNNGDQPEESASNYRGASRRGSRCWCKHSPHWREHERLEAALTDNRERSPKPTQTATWKRDDRRPLTDEEKSNMVEWYEREREELGDPHGLTNLGLAAFLTLRQVALARSSMGVFLDGTNYELSPDGTQIVRRPGA